MPTAEAPRAVVTLVHGTWGRNSAWLNEGSALRQAVTRGLGAEPLFRIFRWSGRNRHRARVDASRELQRHLRDVFARYPAAEHYVVAHSHGGNVLTYALRDVEIQQRLAGVVCMGTPFLSVEADETTVSRARGLGASIFVAYVLFLVPFTLALSFVPGWSENPPAWLLAVWFVLAGLLLWMWRSVRGPRGERRRTEIVSALAQPRLENPPFLCVYVAADEAKLGIRTATAFATPDQALGQRLGRIYETALPLVCGGGSS